MKKPQLKKYILFLPDTVKYRSGYTEINAILSYDKDLEILENKDNKNIFKVKKGKQEFFIGILEEKDLILP